MSSNLAGILAPVAVLAASWSGTVWRVGDAQAAEAGISGENRTEELGRARREARALRVVVTIAPLAGIVKPLLPDDAEIVTLLTPGKSEHGYEFTPAELATLGRADLIVYVGIGLEPQVDRFLARNTRGARQVVELGKVLGIAVSEDAKDGHEKDGHEKEPDGHQEGHEAGEHHHLIDPHVWLDPELVEEALPAIELALLSAIDTVGATPGATPAALSVKAERVQKQVAAIDDEYRTRLAPFKGRAIVTHHAAFGRLAARYGLRVAEVIRPIEADEPTPGQIAEVVSAIKKEHVGVIFVEPQFNATAARRIAQSAGVRVGTLDPLGDGDWFKMMKSNLDELVEKLGTAK